MASVAGAGLVRWAAALTIVYACGYVTGALLVDPKNDRTTLALGIVRLIAGLLLTAVAFLLSLEFSLPWFAGPAGLFACAVVLHGRTAFAPPRPHFIVGWDSALAGVVAVVVMAPPVISAIRMAPGSYPPVFFNVDVPYFLEKVHALVRAYTYPPDSLSVVDGRRPYHFGVHAIAALISRGSGLAPHHSVFLIVVPLLTAGILAAAVGLAQAISPALPSLVAVPLLLISVPTLWHDFWPAAWPHLRDALSFGSFDPLDALIEDWEMWGVTSNIQNLAGHFLLLASLGAIASAPLTGWRLPSFLIGSAVLFKSPTGVALASAFSLAQTCRSIAARSLRPLIPAVVVAAVFGLTYAAFWILPRAPLELKTSFFLLFHLKTLESYGGVFGFVLDVAWLFLPVLVILPARIKDSERRSLPLLFFAVAPFLVVNLLRSQDLRRGFGISGMNEDDWRQIMLPVPLMIHAFVLSVVGRRWTRLGTALRTMFLCVVVLEVFPPVLSAARYGHVLIVNPKLGHEFVDNRLLAEALAVIPTEGTLIVTNDLRYPADRFQRDNRQMQIPALFGHQAFAVNYVYEAYPFSRQRLKLQALLQVEHWSDDTDEAARANHWTHLLIRKDYPHPDPIPLERIMDNEVYSVFRFIRN